MDPSPWVTWFHYYWPSQAFVIGIWCSFRAVAGGYAFFTRYVAE
jgi:hypothetical protein